MDIGRSKSLGTRQNMGKWDPRSVIKGYKLVASQEKWRIGQVEWKEAQYVWSIRAFLWRQSGSRDRSAWRLMKWRTTPWTTVALDLSHATSTKNVSWEQTLQWRKPLPLLAQFFSKCKQLCFLAGILRCRNFLAEISLLCGFFIAKNILTEIWLLCGF